MESRVHQFTGNLTPPRGDLYGRLARGMILQFEHKDIEACLHDRDASIDDLKSDVHDDLAGFYNDDITNGLPKGVTIYEIQFKLKTCLLLRDAFVLDHRYGSKTFIAMCYFQKQSGLAVTGFPDTQTLEALSGKQFTLKQNSFVDLKYNGIHTPNTFRFSRIPQIIVANRLRTLGLDEWSSKLELLEKKSTSYMSVLMMLAQDYDMQHTGDKTGNIYLTKISEYQTIIDGFEESLLSNDKGKIDGMLRGIVTFFETLDSLQVVNTQGKKFPPFRALVGRYNSRVEQGDPTVALDFSYDVLNTHHFLRNYLLSKSTFNFQGFSENDIRDMFSGKGRIRGLKVQGNMDVGGLEIPFPTRVDTVIHGGMDIGGIKIPFPPREFIVKTLQKLYIESEAFLGLVDPAFVKRGLFEALLKNIDIEKIQIPEGVTAQQLKVMIENCIYKMHLAHDESMPVHRDQSLLAGFTNLGMDFYSQFLKQVQENTSLRRVIPSIDADPKSSTPVNLFVPGLLCNAGYLEQFGAKLSELGVGGIHFSKQPAYKTMYDIEYQAQRVVGQLISIHTKYPNRDINLIGHSLGAQVCFRALQILQADDRYTVLVEKIKKCLVLAPVMGRVPMAGILEIPELVELPELPNRRLVWLLRALRRTSVAQINQPGKMILPGNRMGNIDINYISFIHDKLVPKYFEGVPQESIQYLPGEHITFLENGHRENIAQIIKAILDPEGKDTPRKKSGEA